MFFLGNNLKMKKITLALLLTLSLSQPVLAAEWQKIVEGEQGEFSVDVSSIKKAKDTASAWVKIQFYKPENIEGENTDHMINKINIDCEGRRFAITDLAVYDKDNYSTVKHRSKPEYSEVFPDTAFEDVVNFVCRR